MKLWPVVIGGLVFGLAAGGARIALSKPAATKPAAPATSAKSGTATAPVTPTPNALSAMSTDFWGEWKATQSSASYNTLKAAVSRAHSNAPTVPSTGAESKPANIQKIVDVSIAKPAEAAKLLSAATVASSDQASADALATVVTMVTSAKTREEAAPLVAPEAKASVEAMTANLSTGIQGLPGIYLSDSPIEDDGSRSAVPSGYTPVSGGSLSCPAH